MLRAYINFIIYILLSYIIFYIIFFLCFSFVSTDTVIALGLSILFLFIYFIGHRQLNNYFLLKNKSYFFLIVENIYISSKIKLKNLSFLKTYYFSIDLVFDFLFFVESVFSCILKNFMFIINLKRFNFFFKLWFFFNIFIIFFWMLSKRKKYIVYNNELKKIKKIDKSNKIKLIGY